MLKKISREDWIAVILFGIVLGNLALIASYDFKPRTAIQSPVSDLTQGTFLTEGQKAMKRRAEGIRRTIEEGKLTPTPARYYKIAEEPKS